MCVYPSANILPIVELFIAFEREIEVRSQKQAAEMHLMLKMTVRTG